MLLRNSDIAFFISFQKLNVTTRRQAVEKVKVLGILAKKQYSGA
jgi:hypothetical protein